MGIIENVFENVYSINYSWYDVKNDFFVQYNQNDQRYRIIMLGDSITEGCAWNELLGISEIANRGIGGDTIAGLYNRLLSIYSLESEMCFIMGGINDIIGGTSIEIMVKNMERVVTALLENGVNPIIQSTLYVSYMYPNWEKVNRAVDLLNSQLKNMCSEKKLMFLDINKELSVNGVLKNEYTYDGIHLSGAGYSKWREIIVPVIGSN